jgi:propanol-preferring alcohol dehydrogenase
MDEMMQAWAVREPGPIDNDPLTRVQRALPEPATKQVRVRVTACGVCRTDLHLAEGALRARRPLVVPGHEVVGIVDALGDGCSRFALGQRVGVAWLARTCRTCRFCRLGRENLCESPTFTGWDVDGGYATYTLANEEYAYALPDQFSDVQAAPLLCAGIIGFRALRRTELGAGGRLGIYGFGGSAHLCAQVAIAEGAIVHVMTRSVRAQELALSLGAASAQGESAIPPEPLDGAILFAPVGTLVAPALEALDRGGTLAIAGIYLSDIPTLNYDRQLFQERTLRSVTANTRADGEEFLRIAAHINITCAVTPYEWTRADEALRDLKHGRFEGAAVLTGF